MEGDRSGFQAMAGPSGTMSVVAPLCERPNSIFQCPLLSHISSYPSRRAALNGWSWTGPMRATGTIPTRPALSAWMTWAPCPPRSRTGWCSVSTRSEADSPGTGPQCAGLWICSVLCPQHSALRARRSALCPLPSALRARRSALCPRRSALCPRRSTLPLSFMPTTWRRGNMACWRSYHGRP